MCQVILGGCTPFMVTGIYFMVFTISFMGSDFPIKETGFPFGGNAFPGIGISVSMRERGKTCHEIYYSAFGSGWWQ